MIHKDLHLEKRNTERAQAGGEKTYRAIRMNVNTKELGEKQFVTL